MCNIGFQQEKKNCFSQEFIIYFLCHTRSCIQTIWIEIDNQIIYNTEKQLILLRTRLQNNNNNDIFLLFSKSTTIKNTIKKGMHCTEKGYRSIICYEICEQECLHRPWCNRRCFKGNWAVGFVGAPFFGEFMVLIPR